MTVTDHSPTRMPFFAFGLEGKTQSVRRGSFSSGSLVARASGWCAARRSWWWACVTAGGRDRDAPTSLSGLRPGAPRSKAGAGKRFLSGASRRPALSATRVSRAIGQSAPTNASGILDASCGIFSVVQFPIGGFHVKGMQLLDDLIRSVSALGLPDRSRALSPPTRNAYGGQLRYLVEND